MPRNFLTELGKEYFYWAGFVFTIAGAIYGFAADQKWTLLIGLLVCVMSCFGFCRKAFVAVNDLEAKLLVERNRADAANSRLENISADLVRTIERTMAGYSRASAASAIIASLRYIERVQTAVKLWSQGFELRLLQISHGQLYLFALVTPSAAQHLLTGDPFELIFRASSKIIRPIATLRIAQPPDVKKGSVIFCVDYALDEPVFQSLRQLAAGAPQTPPKEYAIRSVFEPGRYDPEQVKYLNNLFSSIMEEMNQPYIPEVSDGNSRS
jgi:hypothetical protein